MPEDESIEAGKKGRHKCGDVRVTSQGRALQTVLVCPDVRECRKDKRQHIFKVYTNVELPLFKLFFGLESKRKPGPEHLRFYTRM